MEYLWRRLKERTVLNTVRRYISITNVSLALGLIENKRQKFGKEKNF
jgi:hypothetical protein